MVEKIDLNHLVLETDAPYLAPVPQRGKRNLPEYLILIAEKMALLQGKTVDEVTKKTTENSIKIFGR